MTSKIEQMYSKYIKSLKKLLPSWSKNTMYIVIGVFIGVLIVGIANPSHIVQKSLAFVGINKDWDQTAQIEQIAKASSSEYATKTNDSNSSDKTDDSNGTNPPKSSPPSQPEPTGSHTIITPEDLQTHKDNGDPYLIQGTDWKVKVNSQSPSSCGTKTNPCPAGTTATVNVSPYNVHTGELLPMTECNGSYSKPYVGGDATPTSLPDATHCILSFTPNSSGMYRLQIELYLSKSVYTDTIYWGGWVWGTDSPTDYGYFVN